MLALFLLLAQVLAPERTDRPLAAQVVYAPVAGIVSPRVILRLLRPVAPQLLTPVPLIARLTLEDDDLDAVRFALVPPLASECELARAQDAHWEFPHQWPH